MTAPRRSLLMLGLVVAVSILCSGSASLLDAEERPQPALRISQVQGVTSRNSRTLKQTFGASSIVPLVVDDSPCVSFNGDDASPILDADDTIVGYTTVHSNGYDEEGLSVMRIDVVAVMANLYFGAVDNSTGDGSNVRATLSTELPDACPTTAAAPSLFKDGVGVECTKRRTSLDVSVPIELFNCTAQTTEDFEIVFFLQVEADLSKATCTKAERAMYSGGLHNRISKGCSYIMVTAACKPSTCLIDTSLSADSLAGALGATGRISRSQMRGNTKYDQGIASSTAIIIGSVVGVVLLVTAVVVGFMLFRRQDRHEELLSRANRESSISPDYMDADKPDSFSPATGVAQSRRQSRFSMLAQYLPKPTGARWSEKHEVSADATGGSGSHAMGGVGDIHSIAEDSTSTPFTPGRGAVGNTGLVNTPGALRMPSLFTGGRTASTFGPRSSGNSVFNNPTAQSLFNNPTASPYSGTSGSPSRLGTASTVARGRQSTVSTPTDFATLSQHPELAPPEDVANVFLNPLAIMGGRRDRDRSGTTSPRNNSFTGAFTSIFAAATSRGLARTSRPAGDSADREVPLMPMSGDDNGESGAARRRAASRSAAGPGPGPVAEGAEGLASAGSAGSGHGQADPAALSPWGSGGLRAVIPPPPRMIAMPPPVNAAQFAAGLASAASAPEPRESGVSRSPIPHSSPIMPDSPK